MNDLLSPDEAEDRLRRTFAGRAGRMAADDGAVWDPVEIAVPLVPLEGASAPPAAPGRGFRRGPGRGRRVVGLGAGPGRKVLLAAAVTLAVAGVVAATQLGGSDPASEPDDDSTAGPGATGSTTSLAEPATTDSPFPLTTCGEWTLTFEAPEGTEPDMTLPDRPHNGAYISIQVATTPMNPEWADQIDIGVYDDPAPYGGVQPTDEEVDINGRPAWYRSMPSARDHLGAVGFDYEGRTVIVEARQVSKEDLFAMARTVERLPDGRWQHGVLPGYENHCDM